MAGFKYNMMDLQAAIGLHQLAGIDEHHARRARHLAGATTTAFARAAARPSGAVRAGDVHARHLYTVLVDERAAGITRDELQARLRERGISTSIHFRALHLHPFYQERFAPAPRHVPGRRGRLRHHAVAAAVGGR